MTGTDDPTRREVLRTGGALGAAAVGLGGMGTVAGTPGNGREFGRVYANGVLWRTNVVHVLDDRPDPEDRLYFLHDGTKPIVANAAVSGAQRSPFVSESAPGDRDWNGGQWTTFGAAVTDVAAFDADAPLTTAEAVLSADYVDVSLGRPGFGPPDFFVCPLNGRAYPVPVVSSSLVAQLRRSTRSPGRSTVTLHRVNEPPGTLKCPV